MSLTAAIGRVRYVERAGRRYRCTAPTLGTLSLALGLCPKECAAFAFTVKEAPAVLELDLERLRPIVKQLLAEIDFRHSEILASCCTLVGGAPGDLEPLIVMDAGLALELAMAVLSLCNLPRVYGFSGMARLAERSVEEIETAVEETAEAEGLTVLETTICGVAAQHGCSPMDVVAWPIEVFMMVCAAAPELHPPAPAEDGGPRENWVTFEQLGAMGLGFGYEKV